MGTCISSNSTKQIEQPAPAATQPARKQPIPARKFELMSVQTNELYTKRMHESQSLQKIPSLT